MRFLRSLRSVQSRLASVTAVAALSIGCMSSSANAQQREVPPPVPSTEVISLLERAGLSNADAALAVTAHEVYFERYRDFERAEVDRWLRSREGSFAGMLQGGGSAAEVEKDVTTRRRLIASAKQLDDQLASEIAAKLPAEKQQVADALRDALARRRASIVVRAIGGGFESRPFSLADFPDFATIASEARAQVQPILAVYEQELTRLWDRALVLAIDRPLRIAELRANRGIAAPVMPAPAAEGEAAPAFDQAVFEQYWRSLQDLRREASADADAARRKVKDFHRLTLAQLEAVLDANAARNVRRWMIREKYPLLHEKGTPEPLFAEAAELHDADKLDDAAWGSVEAERAAYDAEVHPIVDEVMKLSDADSNSGMIMFFEAGQQQSDKQAILERKSLVDARSVERMRAILGKPADEVTPPQVSQGGMSFTIDGGTIDLGEALGEAVTASVMIGVGDGNGEMIIVSGDEFSGGSFASMGYGGGDRRIAKAMSRADADALAKRLSISEAERVVFDAVFEDYALNGKNIEASFSPKSDHSADDSPQVMFGAMRAMQGQLAELRGAIEAADASFFADLGVVCPTAMESGALAAAEHARARALATSGEAPSAATADIAEAFIAAEVSAEGRASALESVTAWEQEASPQFTSRAHELDAIARQRMQLENEMQIEMTHSESAGGVSQSTTVTVAGDNEKILDKMLTLEARQTALSVKAEKSNLAALGNICAALPEVDGTKLRRAWQRLAYPRVYDAGSSAEGIFVKALALRELSAEQRAAIEVMKSEYNEAVEALAGEFIARPAPARANLGDGPEGLNIVAMQTAERERKRLTADREELNQSAVRRLKETLGADLGAKVGDLPVKKKRSPMQFQIGG